MGCLATVLSAWETLNPERLEGYRVHTAGARVRGTPVSRIPECLALLHSVNRMECRHYSQHRDIRSLGMLVQAARKWQEEES